MKKLVALFAVVAAVFAVSCSSPATPGEVAVNIYELIADGKYEAVAEEFHYDSEDANEVAEAKALIVSLCKEKAAPQIEAKGGLASAEVVDEVVAEDGNTAKATVKFVYGNGEEDTQKVDLVKNDDGDWKVAFNK
ncbi:MAG: DUF4878 domain-containing protein [Alistipes sp.]|nr:DUF4878 domain-containing protein [Alistipes sp.]